MYWWRRWTGRDRGEPKGAAAGAGLARSASGGAVGAVGGMGGSVKSFYSSDPTGSEVEIAIQPGSARYAGGQMMMPQSGAHCRAGWLPWGRHPRALPRPATLPRHTAPRRAAPTFCSPPPRPAQST